MSDAVLVSRAERTGAGVLWLAAGTFLLVAVANPALFDVWSADPAGAVAIEADHHGAWLFTMCFLAAGFATSVAAVTVLARMLRTTLAWVAAVSHVVGAT